MRRSVSRKHASSCAHRVRRAHRRQRLDAPRPAFSLRQSSAPSCARCLSWRPKDGGAGGPNWQSPRRTAQPQGSGVHRQKHRTVGQDPLTGELVCLPHEVRVKPATVALVRHRRVHETVAENHRPARKRRTNDLRHDLRACSLVQIELRAVVEHVVLRVKHDCAQVFSHFRAARLTQAHHVQARLFQDALHKRDLRGLAYAFAAFERNEHARQAVSRGSVRHHALASVHAGTPSSAVQADSWRASS